MAMPPVAGIAAGGWPGVAWGLLAAALCGGVPALVIWAGVRSGRLGDRHITDRAQRPRLLVLITAAVAVALAVLVTLGAPAFIVWSVISMLAGLAVTAPLTLLWKVSFHAAVAAGTVVTLAQAIPPHIAYPIGAPLVALVAWARVELTDHTFAQTAVGALLGAATCWTVFALAP
ncbi:hypothetical protein D5H75_30740 [Bailinhaonella thermotolerans]|uniref:PAP2 superfamily protein n=2 Tax=Bailinhaonella thermotolerans TaxID=1070861 RepID=A0A3A4ACH8_9ACTN|nr:hypothetical protein D5H75_30740 [Bailinhaonella thermotolerans]